VQAVFAEDAEPARRVAEHHQVFAEEPRAHRRAIAFGDLLRQAHRQPVLPHELAHRRIALDPAQQFVVLFGHHPAALRGIYSTASIIAPREA
jgi:hypothetical protein